MPAKLGPSAGLRRLAAILLALLLAGELSLAVAPAAAQERYSRFNIFRQIFGPSDREPERLEEPRRKRAEPRRSTREVRKRPSERADRSRERSAPAAPVEAPVDKLADARVVLVVGDFLASGLAESLETVFEQNPAIRVVDRSNGSSGFVRDDFYNWPAEIGPLLETERPAALVVMLGSNDRQQIKTEGRSEPVRSETWLSEYEARIEAFTAAVTEKKVPLIWVGMPPFRLNNMSSDMLAFNDIYRRAAEEAGGVFVDIWEGFVDENGGFISTGPDVNGQPVKLRGSDGINMTKAGKRKIAFYVEKPLNRILDAAAVPGVAALGEEGSAQPAVATTEPTNIERTVPISLNDPELDGGAELLGANPQAPPAASLTPARRLAVEGVAPPATAGRADDFTWNPTNASN